MTIAERIAELKTAVAAFEAESADHYEEDGRLARLAGGALGDNPYFVGGNSYADQSRAAQEFHDGWVAENVAIQIGRYA